MKAVALAAVVAGCAPPSLIPAQVGERLTGGARPGPGRAELVMRCSHPDAEVAVDGVAQGTCQDYAAGGLPLRARPTRVSVTKAGFYPWESWVEADGTSVIVEVTLSSKGGSTP